MSKIIIKSIYRWNNWTKFRKWITREEFVHFRSTKDTGRHTNIKFTKEKQINHFIAFLDVFISGINIQNLTLQTHHKSTYTGLLLSFKSFTSFSYKISLIKYLIDGSNKICNNWNSFHNDIDNIKSNLIKNA